MTHICPPLNAIRPPPHLIARLKKQRAMFDKVQDNASMRRLVISSMTHTLRELRQLGFDGAPYINDKLLPAEWCRSRYALPHPAFLPWLKGL